MLCQRIHVYKYWTTLCQQIHIHKYCTTLSLWINDNITEHKTMNCIMFTKKDGKESNYAHKSSNFKIKYCILIMKLNEKDTHNYSAWFTACSPWNKNINVHTWFACFSFLIVTSIHVRQRNINWSMCPIRHCEICR